MTHTVDDVLREIEEWGPPIPQFPNDDADKMRLLRAEILAIRAERDALAKSSEEDAFALGAEITALRQDLAEMDTAQDALRADAELLASHIRGWTPDLNTQTPDDVDATMDMIQGALDRVLPVPSAGPARAREAGK